MEKIPNLKAASFISFFRGLNRLRKKAEFLAKCLKSIPQGLKPALILLALFRG